MLYRTSNVSIFTEESSWSYRGGNVSMLVLAGIVGAVLVGFGDVARSASFVHADTVVT